VTDQPRPVPAGESQLEPQDYEPPAAEDVSGDEPDVTAPDISNSF
jgi:hypothetical protein